MLDKEWKQDDGKMIMIRMTSSKTREVNKLFYRLNNMEKEDILFMF